MRGWGLCIALCVSVGCYEGPKGDPIEGEDTDTTEDTAPPPGSTAPMSTSGPASTSGPTGDDATSDPDPTTGSEGGTMDPGDTGDSSGGMMSGCEGGPLAEPLPGCAPPPPPSTGDIHQDCVDRINQLRWECQCLPPLARWSDAEACSDQQSSADQNGGGPHGNFGSCGENAQNTCPNWGSEQQIIGGCLQAMWDEGPGEPFSEHGHYINMSNTNYSRVACGFSYDGGVWSNQNFSP
ncbi:MAG: hypothetical protein KDK70_09170 [Myxococcales bacterium]|nr:hypothetical protein [Myxococcales bacterium]